jgi:hypothetical protein
MRYSIVAVAATALLTAPAWAQDANVGTLAQERANDQEVNNGTNPTILATTAGIQYKYTDFGSGFSNDLFEAYSLVPFGAVWCRKQYVPGIPAGLRLRANR